MVRTSGVAVARVDGSGGVSIHYRVRGEGPALVWHTGGCGDATMWERAGYVDALPGYRHVLLDHRGRGSSSAPADLAGHTMSAYVHDVLAVLDDADIERAGFVGYSFGARVGYAAGLTAPDRMLALVALDSVPDPTQSPDAVRSSVEDVLRRGTRAVIEEFAADELEPAPPWLVEHLIATDALAFAGGIAAEATEPDLWAGSAEFGVSTLIVLAVGDGTDPGEEGADWWEWGRTLADRMPHGEAVALPGVRHLAAFWRTDLTVPLIRAFLAQQFPAG
jgi:pimeloyl-ACP methyl ester carboxylesterase